MTGFKSAHDYRVTAVWLMSKIQNLQCPRGTVTVLAEKLQNVECT